MKPDSLIVCYKDLHVIQGFSVADNTSLKTSIHSEKLILPTPPLQSTVNKWNFIELLANLSDIQVLVLIEPWIHPEKTATLAALCMGSTFSHKPHSLGRVSNISGRSDSTWACSTTSGSCNIKHWLLQLLTIKASLNVNLNPCRWSRTWWHSWSSASPKLHVSDHSTSFQLLPALHFKPWHSLTK